MGRNSFLLFFLLLPFLGLAQNTLQVEVKGVKTSHGKISVAVYNNEAGFLKFDQVYKVDSTLAQSGVTYLSIDDLPEGEYALAIFHDENGNDQLDTNWLGIPKEPLGFSHGKMKTFGPPSYKECLFTVKKDASIAVEIK